MKLAVRTNNMGRMKAVFTSEIFTESTVAAHAVKEHNPNDYHLVYCSVFGSAFVLNAQIPNSDLVANNVDQGFKFIIRLLPVFFGSVGTRYRLRLFSKIFMHF